VLIFLLYFGGLLPYLGL